jgi:hypothetical protein
MGRNYVTRDARQSLTRGEAECRACLSGKEERRMAMKMKRVLMVVCVLAVGGGGGLVGAGHNTGGAGTFKPTKIVQGVIKAIDFQHETVTVEIVEGQPVTLKVHVDALDQLDRTGKVGKRVELRLNEEDIVHVVAVGLGP